MTLDSSLFNECSCCSFSNIWVESSDSLFSRLSIVLIRLVLFFAYGVKEMLMDDALISVSTDPMSLNFNSLKSFGPVLALARVVLALNGV